MDATYFDKLIEIHQDDIASFRRRTRFLIFGGGAILMLSGATWLMALTRKIDISLAPPVTSLIGTFVSFSSLFPYKEITPKRLAVARLEYLKQEWENAKDLTGNERNEHIRKISDSLNAFQ